MYSNDLDDKIIAFCKNDSFKGYVRKAINDEFFWRDILNKYNINNIVLEEINKIVPTKVKKEIKNIVPNMVEKELNNFIFNKLSEYVLKEVNNQVPIFLNNNYLMQQILNNHSVNLNQTLEIASRSILDKIVHDPSYHEITKMYLFAIEQKGDKKIAEIDNNFLQSYLDKQNQFENFIKEIKYITGKELEELKNKLNDLNKLVLNQTELKIKIKNLEKDNYNIKTWLYMTFFTGIISVSGYILMNLI